MCVYRIADIVINVNFVINEEMWKKFISHDRKEFDLRIIKEDEYYDDYQIIGYHIPQISFRKIFFFKNYVLLASEKWDHILITSTIIKNDISSILIMVFYTHAIQRRMVQIHSSMIDHHGNGLLFLGPSGIGKTTQAELWNQYRGALIINGDMNFVQETEEGFLGWGTPWHGSSPYCENTNVPVRALVVLKQADRNSIRELDGFEKVQLVSNNVIYPTWLENGMELCLDVLDHLLRALPVYELSCRPDEEAVALTEKTIFGENRKW